MFPQGSLTLSGGLKAPGLPPGTLLATWEAAGYYLAFLGAQILLHLVLPGKRGQGVTLKDKSQLTYKFTGKFRFSLHCPLHIAVNEPVSVIFQSEVGSVFTLSAQTSVQMLTYCAFFKYSRGVL